MIEKNVKIKNGLLEKLYERLSDKLEGVKDFQAAKDTLISVFQSFEKKGHSFTIEACSSEELYKVTIMMKGQGHDLVQLHLGENNSYFFNISPPNQDDTIEEQISLAKGLIAHLDKRDKK